jgi:hypothetical protein
LRPVRALRGSAARNRPCIDLEEAVALPSALSVLRRATGFLVTGFLLTGLLAAASTPVKAELGPCRPDQNGGQICGEGPGAARIIDGTISPSRRLAFAWRSPNRPPTEDAEEGEVESLLIRLSDGAALWRTEGLYWNTGTMHANKYNEDAAWSPNSRFAVVTTDVRWWTHTLRLFAIGANDEILVLDLKAVIEPVVRKHVPRNVEDGDFAIFGSANGERPHLTIDDHGVIKALVVISAPKRDPDAAAVFDVTFRAFQRN